MSTVFSGGYVLQSDIWELCDALRNRILDNYPLFSDAQDLGVLSVAMTKDIKVAESIGFKLQLFPIGDKFWFRFLTPGYYVENNIIEWAASGEFPNSFEYVSFHTGGASTDEIDKEYGQGTVEFVEDTIGKMVDEQHYYVVTLVDVDTMWKKLWHLKKHGQKRSG